MRLPCEAWSEAFQHEAFFYSGMEEYLDGTLEFIRDGLSAGEAVLVVVSAAKIAALWSELHDDADRVGFADMAEVGVNPARIIPAWRALLNEHAITGRAVRGIGEPIWRGRSPAELVECQRHETLLNVSFVGSGSWRLLCPYDVETLDAGVLEEAERSHPWVLRRGARGSSTSCRPLSVMASPFDTPLPEPPPGTLQVTFRERNLAAVRMLVAERAQAAGFDPFRIHEVVLAVHEVAANSVFHAGGTGVLRVWQDGEALIAEVRDDGRIADPLVGRHLPSPEEPGGRGLWLVNQLCDLVQVRTFTTGNVVRIHMAPTAPDRRRGESSTAA